MWRLHEDQVLSAQEVLKRAEGVAIEMIPTTAEDGISTIAFALKDAVDGYGAKVAEIAMDSTCKPPIDAKNCETDCCFREDKRRWV